MILPREGAARRRGYYIIALLLVVAILLILAYEQLKPDDKAAPINQATVYMDRSRDVLCESNRIAIGQNLTMWRVDHANEVPTVDALRQAGFSVPTCPKGGSYTISRDGSMVYCSVHSPDPAAPPTPQPSPSPLSPSPNK
jgi:hypothetical protein